MYQYQKDNRFFAQVPGMMESLCEQELRELGAENTKVAYRGVYFEANEEALYRINYTSRMITRVLAPLASFPCRDANILKKNAGNVAWDDFFSLDHTFSITASVANSGITNSLYAAQCLKDGIADYFRRIRRGRRPDVKKVDPDVRVNLHIENDKAVVSLDMSGESLHKRGYRLLAGLAPMQETLAAAIVRLSGWDGEKPFWDCMCGSGTILCEALMHYCRLPTQTLRKKFGFFHLPDFDKEVWETVKAECDAMVRPLPKGLISGSDISGRMLDVTRKNASRLPFSDAISLECKSFQESEPFENGILVANPPYGIRLGEFEDAQKLYTELGDFIKQKCKGTTAFIYAGDPGLRKSIGLRTSRRIPLVNGKIEGVLVQIDSYEGSKKKYYAAYKVEELSQDKKSDDA